MKKILLVVLCCILGTCLFAVQKAHSLIKVDILDDFGDPTGESYITFDSDLSGTYTTSSVSKGNLKWNMLIHTKKGLVAFILKEEGKDKGVSTGNWGSTYSVIFKNSKNETFSTTGGLGQSPAYNLNCIYVGISDDFEWEWDCREYFTANTNLKIVIKSNSGSYSLGSIDFSSLESLFFDKTLYNQGIRLMNSGKYEEALEVFSEFKETSLDSYEHYKTFVKESECRRELGEVNIGDIGPSGGYIFYDCDADNDSGNADGLISSDCGWRFLEAAPEDLNSRYPFGYYRISSSGSNLTVGTKTAIGTGKANTVALVKAMGETTYTSSNGTTKGIYAAKACADYSITVDGVVYDDWFLPSKNELNLMFENLYKQSLGSFAYNLYWSSSEYGYDLAWNQFFYNGDQGFNGRGSNLYVRPVRAF